VQARIVGFAMTVATTEKKVLHSGGPFHLLDILSLPLRDLRWVWRGHALEMRGRGVDKMCQLPLSVHRDILPAQFQPRRTSRITELFLWVTSCCWAIRFSIMAPM
jgi:hypothetical protein